MPKSLLPEIHFDRFLFSENPDLFASNRIFINEEYQRGDIWKPNQKVELIRSIISGYSIGVLVLFVNDKGQYEILDGQQRLSTIRKYSNGDLDLMDSDIPKHSDLGFREKKLLDVYPIFYLKLKNHNPETKEEDVVQTFLRLQEGTPLNKAEKINAYRGAFKDTFQRIRETHPFFTLLGKDKRFRWCQLAARNEQNFVSEVQEVQGGVENSHNIRVADNQIGYHAIGIQKAPQNHFKRSKEVARR